ncbi:glutathione S-transferase family protein [Rheinheimera riviphila]|uniref:Glutathione S-transferase family protein n=1 Tax=Rheinheimera riviphila TaxID=1834037 RepID=A0A437R2C0_9GAMM|nr:glutathione S-transferase family protein [Rheinheimera riviphila]RVU40863.1 glutathione S-transferase family protein [Rheinheimera riviphila]
MKLYGSLSSPFVRRLRLLLVAQPYEFISLNIFETAGRETLVQLNPTRKVPMLQDGELVIFDSGVIFRYLCQKLQLPVLSWADENRLTMINAVNDSLVELLLCQRSGFDTQSDKLFFNLQHERVTGTLQVLEQEAVVGQFADWDYLAISLYCLLDWVEFRQLADLMPYPALQQFMQVTKDRAGVAQTDPRLAG